MDQVRFESGRNRCEVTKLALVEKPWQLKTIARNETGVHLDTCECTTGSTAAVVAGVAEARGTRQVYAMSGSNAALAWRARLKSARIRWQDMQQSAAICRTACCSEEQAFQRLRVSGSTGEGEARLSCASSSTTLSTCLMKETLEVW